MQCSNCGKTGFVVVSGKRYCSACGAKYADQGAPRAMSDIQPSASKPANPADSITAAPAPAAASDPVAIPVTKPANQFHARPATVRPASGGVLDLRAKTAEAGNATDAPAKPELLLEDHATDGVVAPTNSTTSAVPVVVVANAAAPEPPTAPAPTPVAAAQPTPTAPVVDTASVVKTATDTVPATSGSDDHLAHAPVITSQQASLSPATSAASGVPPVDLAAAAPIGQSSEAASTPAITTTHPLVKRFPEHPAVAGAAPAIPAPNPDLPGQVATQLEALQAQMGIEPAPNTNQTAPAATTVAPVAVQSPELQQALDSAKTAKAPSVLKIGAALTAIAIMGGFVWLQNSPKLAFHSAASRAGIEASLPTYIPSSYHQAGPASVGDGQLTLEFRSPTSEDALKISQKRTAWDSNSLRENYVARQSDNYVAVSGQGLTIFLYNDNASWVNHGIWYSVSGTAKLSREQILKVAYGL